MKFFGPAGSKFNLYLQASECHWFGFVEKNFDCSFKNNPVTMSSAVFQVVRLNVRLTTSYFESHYLPDDILKKYSDVSAGLVASVINYTSLDFYTNSFSRGISD